MKKRVCLIIPVIILILLTACMNQSNNEQKQVEKKETAPETLTTVSEGIDELLTSVDSISEIMDLTEPEFQAERAQESSQQQNEESQSEEQSDNGNEESGQQQGEQNQEQSENGEGESEGQGKGQEQQDKLTKDEELFLNWKQVDEKLEEIHENWNSYEVEGTEKGANHQKANELKKNLNNFTVAVDNRQMQDIMDAGSKTINSLAVFFELYKDEIRGDLSRIKYSAYQAFLQATDGNMEDANNLLDETEEYTARIRQKLEDDDDKTKDLEKLTLAISDMKLALEDNNIKLLEIKRDVALKNIKSLQE